MLCVHERSLFACGTTAAVLQQNPCTVISEGRPGSHGKGTEVVRHTYRQPHLFSLSKNVILGSRPRSEVAGRPPGNEAYVERSICYLHNFSDKKIKNSIFWFILNLRHTDIKINVPCPLVVTLACTQLVDFNSRRLGVKVSEMEVSFPSPTPLRQGAWQGRCGLN